MKLSLDSAPGAYLVKAYAARRIVLVRHEPGAAAAQQVLTASAIVSPAQVQDWSPPAAGPEFPLAALEPALALAPQVLLLGSGRRLRWPAPAVMRAINARGAGFEVMDTASACRTYNVLALEGRRVVAALIME